MGESKEKKNGVGSKVGAVLGAASGALGTVMANPLGRWAIFQSQDSVGRNVQRFVYNVSNSNYDIAEGVRTAYDVVTNAIMANPAVLPIAGGVICAGVGALIGGKISKAKLKKQSLSQKKVGYAR